VSQRLRPIHGVALLFLANGLAHPSLWPRLPEIADAVGATPATFGLALLGTGVGGIVGSVLAPRLARVAGVPRAAVVSAAVLMVGVTTVGIAPTVPALFAAFALVGLVDGVADITQNALMFDVQRLGERSVASRMHAVWSVGALAGTGVGTAAASLRVGVVAQTIGLAAIGLVLVATARRATHDVPVARAAVAAATTASTTSAATTTAAPPGTDPGAASSGRPPRRLGLWVLVATTGLVVASVESVANEWSALTLREGLGTSLAVAGLGPTSYAAAMLVGRLVGDRAIDRVGAAATARAGAAAVVVGGGGGLALAAWLDVPALLLGGLIVAGVGTATLFPLMLAAGDRLDPSGRGVAVASLGARAGFLVVPVVVGAVGDRFGLVVGFGLLPLAGAVTLVALPRALRAGRPASER
jgi:MFS family permease